MSDDKEDEQSGENLRRARRDEQHSDNSDQESGVERAGENDSVFRITVKQSPTFQIRSITRMSADDSDSSPIRPGPRNPKRILEESSDEATSSATSSNQNESAVSNDEKVAQTSESKRARQDKSSPVESRTSNQTGESTDQIAEDRLEEDIDLSDVKLAEGVSVKRSSESEGDKQKSQTESRKPMPDPCSAEYWQNIYDTDYYKSKSLKIYDIMNKELGCFGRASSRPSLFTGCNSQHASTWSPSFSTPQQYVNKGISSLNFVRQMKLLHSLDHHRGCVNSLNFNRIGTMLASGSDDMNVAIWDWSRKRLVLSFETGHKSNVFQSKFVPYTGDSQIVTCARDGQVRLALISSSGSHIGTRKVAKHTDSCHKLSIEYDSCNMFLSAGEDGAVFEIDLRQSLPAKILKVKHTNRSNSSLPLYSVSTNPANTYQFAVAGRDQYIRVYDKRVLVTEPKVLKMFSPLHMKDAQRASITCAVYSNDGKEIIGSYSDEDIYLFESDQDESKDAKHRYSGHRNSDTIKGVNFYGADSEFIVSGSDCGRVFFWEKESEQIVNYLKGDERGIVNVLEPHPSFPILASSGLDNDVKIWSPTAESPNQLEDLKDIIQENQRSRDTSRHFSLSSFEFELLLLLMHRPQNRVFYRTRGGNFGNAATASSRTNEQGSDENSTAAADTGDSESHRINLLRNRYYFNEDDEDEDTNSDDTAREAFFEYVADDDDDEDDDEEPDNDSDDEDYDFDDDDSDDGETYTDETTQGDEDPRTPNQLESNENSNMSDLE